MARHQPSSSRPETHASVMAFVERFAGVAEAAGVPRMTGRVMGYLMVLEDEMISSADLAAAVGASAGSISVATRYLVNMGFIRRVLVPGDRRHYFVAADDMWGSFLSSDRAFIETHRQLFAEATESLAGQLGERGRDRVRNGLRYMTWMNGMHHRLYEEWQAYRKQEPDR